MKKLLLTTIALFLVILAKAETGTHWSFSSELQYQMNVTAVMYYNGESMLNADDAEYYEIGAFVGDECRGSYLPGERPVPFGGGYVYSMTLFSDVMSGENITFRLYNHQTETEMDIICNTTIEFEDGASVGNMMNPTPIQFYPDPTPRYIITVAANPATAGTVTGGGRFAEGTERTVTATPSVEYNFVNWTNGNTVVSTNASYTFTVTEAADLVANFSIKTFEINATAEPTAYGTVAGSGTYDYGLTVTLTASPNIGYVFFNWTKNGQVISTEPEYSFTATDGVEGNYVAHFATKIYTVTATANPTAGGTVSGAGQIQEGQTCTLVATPNIAYNFVNWTQNGNVVSTDPTYSFEVLNDAAFVANFEMKTFVIVTTANPATYGQALGGNTYNYGATVNLAAIPSGDYIFANWTKDGEVVSTNAVYSFTAVDGVAGEYVANFTTVLYDITASVTPAGKGSVTGTGAYSEGQSCTLVAMATVGYKFVNWTKNGVEVSTSDTYTFTVTGAAHYVANFTTITPYWTFDIHTQYQMTATVELYLNGQSLRHDEYGHYYELGAFVGDDCRGSYLPSEAPAQLGGGYIYGMTIFSNKQSGENIVFQLYDHYNDTEIFVDCNTPLPFVANTIYGNALNPMIVELVVDTTPRHYVTATTNPVNGGTVTGAGRYKEGTSCTLTATPDIAYNFVNWTKNGNVVSTNPSYTFTVTEAAEYVANFSIKTFDITVAADPDTQGSVSGAGTYEYGSTVTLTGTPNTGYIFFNWTKNGQVVSSEAEYSFTAVDGVNGQYVGHFATKIFEVTATANPTNGGTVSGTGQIQEGQTCTLVATPSTGYNFVNWTKVTGEVVSTDASYSFVVMDNESLIANFELKTYAITVTATPAAYGTVTGAGTYVYGTTCTLIATTNEDYIFVNWTLNDVVVSDQPTYSFVVNDETAGEYVGHFARSLYQIIATANPTNGGTVTGTGAYMEGQTCTLTATPNLHYRFVNWTKDNEIVSTESTFSFVIADGLEGLYVANFEEITCHWTFNTHLQYDITVTAVLYIDGASMRHEEATAFYEMGAFVGNDCRGSFLPSAAPTQLGGGFIYSMKVYSNIQSGETVTFRLYDHFAEEEMELTCGTSFVFVANNNMGNALMPYEVNFMSTPSYDITLAANPTEGGTVSGAGTYLEGTEITIVATPGDIYNFVNWTLGNEVVSTDASYTFTVMGEGEYVANFEYKSYDITATANPTAGGEIEGTGTYMYGTECTLTAVPGEAYNFLNWSSVTGEVLSTETAYTFTVTGEANYVANFELKTYQVSVTCNPATSGYVLGAGTFVHGSTCTLTAASSGNNFFVNWTENDVEVSREASYAFTVTEDHNLVANYLEYHWTANFGQFPDVMAIVSVVNIEGVEQVSDMIEIAAFIGDECRGREVGIAVPVLGHTYYFLMVTGEEGEVFDSYRLYNHETQEEYDLYCFQEIEFEADGDMGDFWDPYVFEFAHMQTYELAPGFNWFSTYIETNGIDALGMIENSIGDKGQRILSQTEYTENYGYPYGWWGSLESVNNESMYRIVMSQSGTVELLGAIADPAEHPITISKGFNHIGLISSTPITLVDAFANLQKTDQDMLKTQTAYTTYWADFDFWWGSIEETDLLMPGQGLTYQSQNNNPVTFTYPSASSSKGTRMKVVSKKDNHWKADYRAYPYNMTVMAVVELADEEIASENYELAAFANGECRGSVRLLYVEPMDRYVAFLTVAGDESTTLDLRLYNSETGEEYFNADNHIVFNVDDMIGNRDNPFVVRFNSSASEQLVIYPNPVNNGERFNIVLTSDESAQVEIVNSIGVVVSSMRLTGHEITMDVPTTPGIYTVRVITDDTNIKCNKLIVK